MEQNNLPKKSLSGVLTGAAFLMATSAIGPGFLNQTTLFTMQLLASFGFVILVSVLLDIGAQLNVWRIITVSGKCAQDIANQVLPGMGFFLSGLIVLGGLAFNIGNIAGAGLGLNVLFGIDVGTGAIISAVIGIGIFMIKEAGTAMDWFTRLLGLLMIGLTLYVVVAAQPPMGLAIQKSFIPDKIDFLSIITIVGGTVGGYISFAGAHRLLEANISGVDALPQVDRSAVTAIGLASVMRILLFLAALGVVMKGMKIDTDNPPASVFKLAAGQIGYKLFGLIMWAAAISSVVGSAFTSISFVKTFHKGLQKNQRSLIIVFIVMATVIFLVAGKPVRILVLAGAINGLILPVALSIMLLAAYRKDIIGTYKHPRWLTIFGVLVAVIMAVLCVRTIVTTMF
jgi:Mn2+/Fe2+ NRAMP family transporter